MGQRVVVVGNPIDGIQIFGPFDHINDAIEWTESLKGEWWIVTLEEPHP